MVVLLTSLGFIWVLLHLLCKLELYQIYLILVLVVTGVSVIFYFSSLLFWICWPYGLLVGHITGQIILLFPLLCLINHGIFQLVRVFQLSNFVTIIPVATLGILGLGVLKTIELYKFDIHQLFYNSIAIKLYFNLIKTLL